MIKPTVGRVVWYRPDLFDKSQTGMEVNGEQPLTAIITTVWKDGLVNLAVFDAYGRQFNRLNIKLHQGDGPAPKPSYCEWMPYQVGQAAKTEALEHDLAEASKDASPEVERGAGDGL